MNDFKVFFVRAMREIQSCTVHPGSNKSSQHSLGIARGPDRAHDLGFPFGNGIVGAQTLTLVCSVLLARSFQRVVKSLICWGRIPRLRTFSKEFIVDSARIVISTLG